MAKKVTTSKKQNKKFKPIDDSIEISIEGEGNAIAAGRGARATSVVINFFGGKWQLLASLLVIILAVGGYFLGKELYPAKMTGDFRIAVADFAVIGNPDEANAGTELAEGVYLKLNESLSEINKDFTITIWSPDKVGKIEGDTSEERAKSAETISTKIGADVLVYGLIDMSKPVWKITPEFYIASDNFYEAEEITGQYQIGETFSLVGQENIARRIELSNKYGARAQAISQITIGLAYFSLRNYQNALKSFQLAENIHGWDESQGKEVLYLLAGNAAMKAKDFDTSITELEKSLSIDPDYGRPLITLGAVYYLQALKPFDKTKIPSDIDLELLGEAIEKYNQALKAKHQPALSDISTKAHFGLGQCYLMQSYAGMDTPLSDAVDEFQIVIHDYENGKNPRIREITAEAHGRLGLIYDLSGYSSDAAQEYQLAADLLFDNPERQKQYQNRAQELLINTPISTP
jgi:tetratricopeptide (TPR) repeat protein